MYQSTADFSLQDGGSNTSHIKLFLSNKIHLLSIIVRNLHVSVWDSQNNLPIEIKTSFISGSCIRGALPLFIVYYAQHRIHRQYTVYLQNIIDFETIPALIDLPQRENNKIQGQMGDMQD